MGRWPWQGVFGGQETPKTLFKNRRNPKCHTNVRVAERSAHGSFIHRTWVQFPGYLFLFFLSPSKESGLLCKRLSLREATPLTRAADTGAAQELARAADTGAAQKLRLSPDTQRPSMKTPTKAGLAACRRPRARNPRRASRHPRRPSRPSFAHTGHRPVSGLRHQSEQLHAASHAARTQSTTTNRSREQHLCPAHDRDRPNEAELSFRGLFAHRHPLHH